MDWEPVAAERGLSFSVIDAGLGLKCGFPQPDMPGLMRMTIEELPGGIYERYYTGVLAPTMDRLHRATYEDPKGGFVWWCRFAIRRLRVT